MLDYFYNTLKNIVDALKNNGFDVFANNSFKDEILIIKSKDGKTIKSIESELVREYEKMQEGVAKSSNLMILRYSRSIHRKIRKESFRIFACSLLML